MPSGSPKSGWSAPPPKGPQPRLTGAGEVPVRAPPPERAPAGPPLFRVAPLTWGILAANVLVFVAQLAASGPVGFAGMPSSVLHAFGANEAAATVYGHRWETLLTSCFVHGSLLHVAFNMIALRQIGPFVERSAGAARMAPLYVLSGIAGSIGSAFFGWYSQAQRVSVGASGAICGLVGAALVLGYRMEGWRSPLMWAMAKWLLALFGIGLFVTYLMQQGGGGGGFDNAAHAGGALAGASIAFAWRRGEPYDRSTTTWVVILCACVCLGTAFRVVRINLTDPYAKLGVDDRVTQAERAIRGGRCADARTLILSLEKFAPDAPQVHLLEQSYRTTCGF